MEIAYHEMQREKNALSLPVPLSLVLDRAINTSKFSGVAWGVRNGDDGKLNIRSSMMGYSAPQLIESIKEAEADSELFLSHPPIFPFFTDDRINQVLPESKIRAVYYPLWSSVLSPDVRQAENHCDWHFASGVKLQPIETDSLAESLLYASHVLEKHHRPWISCFLSGQLNGRDLAVDSLLEDSICQYHIKQHLKQSHAVVVDQTVSSHHFSGLLNNAGAQLPIFNIERESELENLLQMIRMLGLASVSLIVEPKMLTPLLRQNRVDYICYFCQSLKKKETDIEPSPPAFVLPDSERWTILETQSFSTGIVINMIRKMN